ncbi:hypothetical protein L1887_52674 [Cichorium endivia]|nr:hypothetical protein L1887_52674 [Cichorium endivia]
MAADVPLAIDHFRYFGLLHSRSGGRNKRAGKWRPPLAAGQLHCAETGASDPALGAAPDGNRWRSSAAGCD